jgi:tetratricopeptide (TPR) repeat protein
MKIRTLFLIALVLFIILVVMVAVWKALPASLLGFAMVLALVVALVLAVLLTQWVIPLLCADMCRILIEQNNCELGEQVARFGVAVGKPLDGDFFRITNFPRHATPVITCSRFLRLALFRQGKFAEKEKLDREVLQVVQSDGGTIEGSGVSKTSLASSTYRTGDIVKALILANEALDELGRAGTGAGNDQIGEAEFRKMSARVLASEKAHAFFVRASILEAMRRYSEALSDREAALSVAQAAFGPEAKEITPHLTMLGRLLLKMKQLQQAFPLLRQSLNLRQRLFKPGHQLIASAQLALSEYYLEEGDLEKSESMLLLAFPVAQKIYSQSPGPGIADFYQAMAFLRQKQKRDKEAEEFFAKARDTYLKYFPELHPVFLELNLAMIELLRSTGRAEECELFEKVNAELLLLFEEAAQHVRS